MALEFASKKETFPKYKVFETELAGRPFVVETGKMCGLSNGSCLVRYGETAVLCNDGAMETGGMPLRLIPTKTAAGTRALPAVRVRELVLEADGAPRRYTGVCAVFTPEPLADGGFCAIVPAEGGVCGA